jgi:hypothetical protein
MAMTSMLVIGTSTVQPAASLAPGQPLNQAGVTVNTLLPGYVNGYQQYATVSVSSSHQPLTINWSNASGSGFLAMSLPSGAPLQPGTTYTTDTTNIVINQNNHVCGTNVAKSFAVARVDQLLVVNGTVQSYAAYFQCGSDNGLYAIAGRAASNITPSTPGRGYYLFSSMGSLGGYGNDAYLAYLGDPSSLHLNKPILGMAITPDGGGYWMAGTDGGVFAYGDAPFYGSAGALHLNGGIVGMAATPDGGGYWLVGLDGGVFSYGDAQFWGSTGGMRLNRAILGIAATPDGGGYWIVGVDGGVFAYGDAKFYGSTGGLVLNKPIANVAATPDGGGYWLVANDGGIFAFGDAQFYGSAATIRLNQPIVAVASTPDGGGYWLVAIDGGVFAYGDAPFYGSAVPGILLVTGMAR